MTNTRSKAVSLAIVTVAHVIAIAVGAAWLMRVSRFVPRPPRASQRTSR